MILILEDKTILPGKSFGAETDASGEVVFSTGMVGYPETLTDPSYRGQILVLAYPLVGNYGIEKSKIKSQKSKMQIKSQNYQKRKQFNNLTIEQFNSFESEKIQISGLIVSEYCAQYSHPQAKQSLGEWLKSEGVPAMEGVDTRALTEKLREKGTMKGAMSNVKCQMSKINLKSQNFLNPNQKNLAAEVSCREPIVYEPQNRIKNYELRIKNILLYDCGVKLSIIRSLLNRGCRVIRVPWNYELAIKNYELRIMNYGIDGVVISNGPGDPTKCDKTIEQIKSIIHYSLFIIPVLGICLGNQIMALATGAKTYKLKYGHRGQNQPVIMSKIKSQMSKINLKSANYQKQFNNRTIEQFNNQAFITSQNHGFAVDEKTLPKDWQVWFKNLNDGTVEGIRHCEKPWLAAQFHPESAPGPTDTEWIFDEFLQQINLRKSLNKQLMA